VIETDSYYRPVSPNELDTYKLGGQTIREWHQFLTTDHYTGQPIGYQEVPASRYGRTADETAWWAIAAHAAYGYATGDDTDTAQSMDHMMSLAVNDDPSVAELITQFRWVVPDELDGMLDWDRARLE
jgi:hypothetical protein